jgi:hypothetical protein
MAGGDLTPGDITDVRAFIERQRSHVGSFDVVKAGRTADASDTDRPRVYAEAGATWWVESIRPWGNSLEAAKGRIRSGPPR